MCSLDILQPIFTKFSNILFNLNTYTTALGAFVGAAAAFLLGIFVDNKQKLNQEKSEIVLFVYDMNILLKRLFQVYVDVDSKLEKFAQGDKKQRVFMFFDPIVLDIKPLHFITNKCPRLYEQIVQQQIDTNILYHALVEYNDACSTGIKDREKLLHGIHKKLLEVIPIIHTNMVSMDAYYKKFYRSRTILKDYLVNIITETGDFLIEKIVEYKKIIDSKEKQINRLTGKKYTKDEIEDLSEYINYFISIYGDWVCDFKNFDKTNKYYVERFASLNLANKEKIDLLSKLIQENNKSQEDKNAN